MQKFKSLFCRTVDIAGFVALMVIVVTCFAQVVYRYIFDKSFFWVEELAVYLMIWIAFLGAAKATATQENTRLGFVVKLFPKKICAALETLAHLITLIFLGFLVYYGFVMASTQWVRYSVAVKIPMALVYGALPVCGVFMAIFTAVAMAETIRDGFFRTKQKEEDV